MRPVDKINKTNESKELLSESALKRAIQLLQEEKLTIDQLENIKTKFR